MTSLSRNHLSIEPIDLPLESPSVDFFDLDIPDNQYDDEYTDSLDPHVLASLVIQLRTNLSTAQHERDQLSFALTQAQTRLRHLEGEHERAEKLATELQIAKQKNQDDEDAIAMLRTKVEESRRGLMRLQTESRRQSGLSGLQSAAPNILSFDAPRTPVYPTSRAAKRASSFIPSSPGLSGFNPATALQFSHRRVSSLSDPGAALDLERSQVVSIPDPMQNHPPPSAAAIRRFSMLTQPRESLLNPLGAEIETLHNELAAVRAELVRSQADLSEANEARLAGDVMVKALREYISENPVGSGFSGAGISLPPLPTDNVPDEDDPPPAPKKTNGWGLRLWNSSPAPPADVTSPPVSRPPSDNGSIKSLVSSWTKSVVPTTDGPSLPPKRKFSLFGPTVISPPSSITEHPLPPLPPVTPVASPQYASSIADTTRTYSSTLSASEPASPEAEIDVVSYNIGDRDKLSNDVDGNTTPTLPPFPKSIIIGMAA